MCVCMCVSRVTKVDRKSRSFRDLQGNCQLPLEIGWLVEMS